MVLGGPAFLHFVVLSSFCLRVSESQSLGSLGSLRVSGMLYSTSLNPMFFKNIANVGSFHFHFHFRIWRIWKIWKSGKSEIKENWKVIWQKPRESRSLGSLGSLGVSNCKLYYSRIFLCTDCNFFFTGCCAVLSRRGFSSSRWTWSTSSPSSPSTSPLSASPSRTSATSGRRERSSDWSRWEEFKGSKSMKIWNGTFNPIL